MSHSRHMCLEWLIHMRDTCVNESHVTQPRVNGSFTCGTRVWMSHMWLSHSNGTFTWLIHSVSNGSFTLLIHMTHSHGSFTESRMAHSHRRHMCEGVTCDSVTYRWLIHMAHSRGSFAWLIHSVSNDPFTPRISHSHMCLSLIRTCVSHSHVCLSRHIHMWEWMREAYSQCLESPIRMWVWMRDPPKNGEIALWSNTRVVKCKYDVAQKYNVNIMFHQNTMGSIVTEVVQYFTHFYILIHG